MQGVDAYLLQPTCCRWRHVQCSTCLQMLQAVPQPALNLPALVMACGRYVPNVPLKDADISNGKSRMLKVVPGTTSVGIPHW
jgi:hypothetical protein